MMDEKTMRRMMIEQQVVICTLYGFLDWSGDNWPQPHRVIGAAEPWDWDEIMSWYPQELY